MAVEKFSGRLILLVFGRRRSYGGALSLRCTMWRAPSFDGALPGVLAFPTVLMMLCSTSSNESLMISRWIFGMLVNGAHLARIVCPARAAILLSRKGAVLASYGEAAEIAITGGGRRQSFKNNS